MDPCRTADTLVELLMRRASTQPDRIAYILSAEGQHDEISLTYRQLDRHARAIGARLQSLNAVGERVLLLYPTSPEYITAFLGCLYAGALPVPAFPPRVNRPSSRIQAIAKDAKASIALTSSRKWKRPWGSNYLW